MQRKAKQSLSHENTDIQIKRQKRQSFDERICDDLSEDILQYLPLKDKFRFESVSKQFQRTIIEKQIDLYFSYDVRNSVILCRGLLSKELFPLDRLTLKKCPNIQSIIYNGLNIENIRNVVMFFVLQENLISFVNNYCKHLNRLDLFDIQIGTKIRYEFFQKFGPKLKSVHWSVIQYDQTDHDNKQVKLFPNIEELSIDDFWPRILSVFKMHFRRLKKLKCICDDMNQDHMIPFLDRHQTLKYLELSLITDATNYYQNIKNMFIKVSKFQNLIHLSILRFICRQEFIELLFIVFENCIHIKSFKTEIMNRFNYALDFKKLFLLLKRIKCLKRLDIRLSRYRDGMNWGQNINVLLALRRKRWKRISNISHLILKIENFLPLNEYFLSEIHKTLPNIQYLHIDSVFTTEEGSTQMADILSRLSRLETLKLKVNNDFIYNQIKAKVIEKCKKIRIIDIEVKEFNQ